jgi:hypothetical protein
MSRAHRKRAEIVILNSLGLTREMSRDRPSGPSNPICQVFVTIRDLMRKTEARTFDVSNACATILTNSKLKINDAKREWPCSWDGAVPRPSPMQDNNLSGRAMPAGRTEPRRRMSEAQIGVDIGLNTGKDRPC